MTEFEILSEIKHIETIATGRGVYIRRYLERAYGKGRKDFEITRVIRLAIL